MDTLQKPSQRSKAMGYAVRPMASQDVPQVAEIEREAFPTTWPPTPFHKELSNHLARYLVAWQRLAPGEPPMIAFVPTQREPRSLVGRLLAPVQRLWTGDRPRQVPLQANDLIAGFVGMWFMYDEAHITAIATRQAYRGRGIGELLLLSSIELAHLRGSRVVTLEVRVSNAVPHALYLKYGFKTAGIRRGYYVDNHEDALVMTTDPIGTHAYQAFFQSLVENHREHWGETVRVLT